MKEPAEEVLFLGLEGLAERVGRQAIPGLQVFPAMRTPMTA